MVCAIVLFSCNSSVFAQRTVALYRWDSKIVSLVGTLFVLMFTASAACIPFYSPGGRLTGTKFCTYLPPTNPLASLYTVIVYKVFSMVLDFTLLILTLHKLLDGGIKALWTKKFSSMYLGKDTNLSSFLIRQGFHYYVIQMAADILFICGYFGFKNPFYKVIPSAVNLAVLPLAAAGAFRDMGRKAKEIGMKNAFRVNEIVCSDSEGNAQSGNTRLTHLQGQSTLPIDPRNTTTTRLDTPRKSGFFRAHNSAVDVENINGIAVVVNTVSRTDVIEEEVWQDDSKDKDAIKMMTRQRSQSGKSEAGNAGGTGSNDVEMGLQAQPLECAARADTVSETGSAVWIPRTPEETYPIDSRGLLSSEERHTSSE